MKTTWAVERAHGTDHCEVCKKAGVTRTGHAFKDGKHEWSAWAPPDGWLVVDIEPCVVVVCSDACFVEWRKKQTEEVRDDRRNSV